MPILKLVTNNSDVSSQVVRRGRPLTAAAGGGKFVVIEDEATFWRDAHEFLTVDSLTERVIVCHNGSLVEIAQESLQDHLDHGDSIGACA